MSDELQWLNDAMPWYRVLQSQQLQQLSDAAEIPFTFFGEKQIFAAAEGNIPFPSASPER